MFDCHLIEVGDRLTVILRYDYFESFYCLVLVDGFDLLAYFLNLLEICGALEKIFPLIVETLDG